MTFRNINRALGNADLFLIDQILKGRFEGRPRILDAGCGEGRNMVYFLRQEYEVHGIDTHADAIAMAQFVAPTLQKGYDKSQLTVAAIENYHQRPAWFHAVLCMATLHFAQNNEHFNQMVAALVGALQPGGVLVVGMESAMVQNLALPAPNSNGLHQMPDGSHRYLLTQARLDHLLQQHQLKILEPVRTVVEHQQRTLTYLVLEKP